MQEILKKLENLQKLFKLYTIMIAVSLILIISYPLYSIIIYLAEKQDYVGIIIFIVFFLLIILIGPISILNFIWEKDAKKLIFQHLPSLIENLDNNAKINIKYSPTKKHSKNINNNLLIFINQMLLLNGINKSRAIYYLSNGFSRNVSIKLEDELIIQIQQQNSEEQNFEAIEVFLEEKYIKTEGFGRRRKTITHEIENFKGIILSTKLINQDKPNNSLINTSDNTNNKYSPIVIYNNTLLTNPTEISFFKNIKFDSSFFTSVFNINFRNIELVSHVELGYKVSNIQNNSYIFHNKDHDINYLSRIASKISEKLYTINKFSKSFGVIFNDTIYLFLNHEDNIFKTRNLFSVPSYLFSKADELENTIYNFKNQLKTLLNLVL